MSGAAVDIANQPGMLTDSFYETTKPIAFGLSIESQCKLVVQAREQNRQRAALDAQTYAEKLERVFESVFEKAFALSAVRRLFAARIQRLRAAQQRASRCGRGSGRSSMLAPASWLPARTRLR